MTKGLRRKCLEQVTKALRDKMDFKKILTAVPATIPGERDLPAAFITLMPYTQQHETNNEQQNYLRFAVILMDKIVEERDLFLADMIDSAEEALWTMSRTSDWIDLFSQLFIDNVDTTPISLAVYNLPGVVIIPPMAAARLDCRVDIHYQA